MSDVANPLSQRWLLLTVTQAAQALNVSRLKIYDLMNTGQLQSVHVGRLRRIPTGALQDYVTSLEKAS